MRTLDITPERYQEIVDQLNEQDLICSITGCTLLCPVTTSNGKIYEKSAIRRWINEKGPTDPLTRLPITRDLAPCEKTLEKMTDLDPETKQVYLNELYSPRFDTDELQSYTEEQKSLFSLSSQIKIITQSADLSSTEYKAHGTPTEYSDNTTGNFLHIAAKHGLNDIIKKAIQQQPKSVLLTSYSGDTIAHIAARNGHHDIIQTLIQNKQLDQQSLFNQLSEDNVPPLDAAASSMHLDIVLTLLKTNAGGSAKVICNQVCSFNKNLISHRLILKATANTDQSKLIEIFKAIHAIDPSILTKLTNESESHEGLAIDKNLDNLASSIEQLINTRRSTRKRTRSEPAFFRPAQESSRKRAKKTSNKTSTNPKAPQ